MVNYNNGKIYKIEAINGDEGDIYIGSTTNNLLSERMAKHRINYRNWKKNMYGRTTNFALFDKYGVENCIISLIENVNCNSLNELRIRETFHMNSTLCVNERIPFRSEEDKNKNKKIYRIENKEALSDKRKMYYEKNKDILNLKQKDRYNNNLEKEKERHAKYYMNNKDEIARKSRIFHELNKETINKATNLKRSIKCKCVCGLIIPECRKGEHVKTKNHIKIMENKIKSKNI
jgi:hypothetical protein